METIKDDLNEFSDRRLKKFSKEFGLDHTQEREQLINNIIERYNDIKKYLNFTYIRQLGHEGKDGRTFLAKDAYGEECAVKIFKKNKNPKSILREVKLQKIASKQGLSPIVYNFDVDGRYIAMEKLDMNLYDIFINQNGQLTIPQQKSIIGIFEQLDQCKIFHADPNPLNFMIKNNRWYIIDFGFAKPINKKTIDKFGDNPNMTYMPIGLFLKLREINPNVKLDYLKEFINKDEIRNKLNNFIAT